MRKNDYTQPPLANETFRRICQITLYREIKRNRRERHYWSGLADKQARSRHSRKPKKLTGCVPILNQDITPKNIFDDLPDKALPKELFQLLIRGNDFKLERIISTGQATPAGKWYNQAQDEWVLLLKGHATLQFEGSHEINLKPGDYVFIERHKKHSIKYTSTHEPCVWLALHASTN